MKIIKTILCYLLVAAWSSLANAYSLEPLTDDAANYIAPSDIQRAMSRFEAKDLDECAKENELDADQKAAYFGSIKIIIGPPNSEYFLVFPSKYCMAFYGAHAIAYWILSKPKTGEYSLLYSGRSDGFEILETTSNGFNDLRSAYGMTFIILKYNGASYEKVSDGEFPQNGHK